MPEIEGHEFGGKSAGLRDLPTGWAPPFHSLSDELHRMYREVPQGVPLRENVNVSTQQELALHLIEYGNNPEDVTLIVRSDAVGEGLTLRGKLSSHKSDATVDGVIDASEHIFQDAAEAVEGICLIVQRNISAQASGHVSNELRVSRDPRSWLCEIVNGPFSESAELPEQKKLWVQDSLAAEHGPLLCSTRAEMLNMLRRIGKYFHDRRLRRHLEWVWDGKRLWVVQNDPDIPMLGDSPIPNAPRVASSVTVSELRVIRVFDKLKDTQWQKLECVTDFSRAGMQTTALYYVTGDVVQEHLAGNCLDEVLESDFNILLEQPIVIRTDLRGETAFLLPRTDLVHSLEAAAAFLIKVLDAATSNQRPLGRMLHHPPFHPRSSFGVLLCETRRTKGACRRDLGPPRRLGVLRSRFLRSGC